MMEVSCGLRTWRGLTPGQSGLLCRDSELSRSVESSHNQLLGSSESEWEREVIITIFLLKIRHENNNIALASPNF